MRLSLNSITIDLDSPSWKYQLPSAVAPPQRFPGSGFVFFFGNAHHLSISSMRAAAGWLSQRFFHNIINKEIALSLKNAYSYIMASCFSTQYKGFSLWERPRRI